MRTATYLNLDLQDFVLAGTQSGSRTRPCLMRRVISPFLSWMCVCVCVPVHVCGESMCFCPGPIIDLSASQSSLGGQLSDVDCRESACVHKGRCWADEMCVCPCVCLHLNAGRAPDFDRDNAADLCIFVGRKDESIRFSR